ncbi:hypothetical protein [Streptomyces acidiscabies]|uniref:Uncharacterized protein n=1 Tax=Streptomyces acidiscabies TaxID=42234 RepID=A0ABU4MB17_9ACTN|nr:hypothetical protein [Streptomyces acidiscabies]MDX3024991.1 hypothetical protein [Streptomyces acidiscabies]
MALYSSWIDSLDPGHLTVEVPAGLTVWTLNPVTYAAQEQPVVCPWCHADRDVTLRTSGRYAVVLCGQGHTWLERGLLASAVRQLHAVRERGGVPADEPFRIPQTLDGVWLWLLPRQESPFPSGAPAAAPTSVVRAKPLNPFTLMDVSAPFPQRAALLSAGLVAWALPCHGTLFARLVLGPRPGHDARLVTLALWRLLLDTAPTPPVPDILSEDPSGDRHAFMSLDLMDLAARLNPDDASTTALRDRLRSLDPATTGFLPAADTAGLRDCSAREWSDACNLAFLTLMVHADYARISQALTAGPRKLTMRRPRLSDCCVIAPHTAP